MSIQLVGAVCFGALIGWYVYYVNRYRAGGVTFQDIVTLIGIVGGAAVLNLFPADTDLFGAYGIGLAVGFFGYYIVLLVMVNRSANFDVDWFLDGRRKAPADDEFIPDYVEATKRPMGGGAKPGKKPPVP